MVKVNQRLIDNPPRVCKIEWMQLHWPKPVFRLSLKIVVIGLVLVTLVSVAAASIFAYLYFYSPKATAQLDEAEIQKLVKEVGQLIALPDGTPTVATVTDKDKLAGQNFFARAENGDRVLIYEAAQKAYLYRPSQSKLIEVAPLSVTQPSPSAAPSVQEIPVSLYNGTTVSGLTNRFEKDLTGYNQQLKIATKKNAATTYEESLIIDLSGQNETLVKDLATKFQLKVESSVPDESLPSSGILIILGADKAPPTQTTPPEPSPSPAQ